MKRGRLPLTALRSFEAAGRHLSFSRAAEELFVSQAAISRQIRELEAQTGRPLFERRHRQVALTESGVRLLDQLTVSFDAISHRLDEIASQAGQQTVTVSVEPSFAGGWLVPRLNLFNAMHPDIDISIDASPAVTDFRGNSVDLAIRHSLSASSWPRVQSRHLTDCFTTPVVAPSALKMGPPLTGPEQLLHYTLLHEDSRDCWSAWLKNMGVENAEPRRGPIFPDASLAARSAALGHGVALGCWLLCEPDLRAGRLVTPFSYQMPIGAYWMVAPDFDKLSKPAQAFADWLLNELEASPHATKAA